MPKIAAKATANSPEQADSKGLDHRAVARTVHAFVEAAGEGELNEEVIGTGLRHAIGELVTCPYRIAQRLTPS